MHTTLFILICQTGLLDIIIIISIIIIKQKNIEMSTQKNKKLVRAFTRARQKAGFPTFQSFCDAYKATKGNKGESLHISTLRGYESGTTRPSLRRWEGILRTLGVPLDDEIQRKKLFKKFDFHIGGELREVEIHNLHTSDGWHKKKPSVSKNDKKKSVAIVSEKELSHYQKLVRFCKKEFGRNPNKSEKLHLLGLAESLSQNL